MLIETTQPKEKLVDHYVSLLVFDGIDEARGIVRIVPSASALGTPSASA